MSVLPEEFTERMARVIKLVRTQRTLPAQLEAVVALSKRTVPACDAAGVSLVVTGEAFTAAATDRVVLEVDLVQYATGQGPCLAAIAESNIVRVDLLEDDSRFVRFAPGAVDTAVKSIVSFPLVAAHGTVGALNLYSYDDDAFDADTEGLLGPIVTYAADVLATSPLYAYSLEVVEGLVATIEERAVIEQATGLLMARNEWTSAEAFAILRDRALVQHQSLAEAATSVLATAMPSVSPPP